MHNPSHFSKIPTIPLHPPSPPFLGIHPAPMMVPLKLVSTFNTLVRLGKKCLAIKYSLARSAHLLPTISLQQYHLSCTNHFNVLCITFRKLSNTIA